MAEKVTTKSKKNIVGKSGRRKTSIARVFMCKGKGKIVINDMEYKKYFPTFFHYYKIDEPFVLLNCVKEYDVKATVRGGGVNAQAEALRLGISKCLAEKDPNYKTSLRNAGLLTRDPRVVESKKAGRKKARKGFQFSKR